MYKRSANVIMDLNRLGSMYPSRLSLVFSCIDYIRSFKLDFVKNSQKECFIKLTNKEKTLHFKAYKDKNELFFTLLKEEDELEPSLIYSSSKTLAYGKAYINEDFKKLVKKALDLNLLDCKSLKRPMCFANLSFLEGVDDEKDFETLYIYKLMSLYLLREFSLKELEEKGFYNLHFIGLSSSIDFSMLEFMTMQPSIIDAWLDKKEYFLSFISKLPLSQEDIYKLYKLLGLSLNWLSETSFKDPLSKQACLLLCKSLEKFMQSLLGFEKFSKTQELLDYALDYSTNLQELLISNLFEVHLLKIQDLKKERVKDRGKTPVNIKELIEIIEKNYDFAINTDFSLEYNKYFYYHLDELGEIVRSVRTPFIKDELPFGVAFEVYKLYQVLNSFKGTQKISTFLSKEPSFAPLIKRVINSTTLFIGELRINTLAKDFFPRHLYRCKLSMFGASSFYPDEGERAKTSLFEGMPRLLDKTSKLRLFYPIKETDFPTQLYKQLSKEEFLAKFSPHFKDKAFLLLNMQALGCNCLTLAYNSLHEKLPSLNFTPKEETLYIDCKGASAFYILPIVVSKFLKKPFESIVLKSIKDRSFIYAFLKELKGFNLHVNYKAFHLYKAAGKTLPSLYKANEKDEGFLKINFSKTQSFSPKAGFLQLNTPKTYAKRLEIASKVGLSLDKQEYLKLKKLLAF